MHTQSAPASPAASIDASWTVNDVLRHHPESAALLNAFGVDTCCGGHARLDEAAVEAGIATDTLLMAIALRIGADTQHVRPAMQRSACCSVGHA